MYQSLFSVRVGVVRRRFCMHHLTYHVENPHRKLTCLYIDTMQNITVREILHVANEPQNLVLTDVTGQEVPLDHADANLLVRQGTMHKINSVLKFTE